MLQAQKRTSFGVKGFEKMPAGLLQLIDNETPETEAAQGLAALAANNTPREPVSDPVVETGA